MQLGHEQCAGTRDADGEDTCIVRIERGQLHDLVVDERAFQPAHSPTRTMAMIAKASGPSAGTSDRLRHEQVNGNRRRDIANRSFAEPASRLEPWSEVRALHRLRQFGFAPQS